MTLEQYEALPAIDKLRRAVKAFGDCNESFLQRFNTVALLQIHKAWPKWDDQERPVYTHD